uniref:Polysaccharide export protein n=1 Tax=Desulfobacca acetoxidans TaxID=60893 RepID=A0A7V4GA85_9BACT
MSSKLAWCGMVGLLLLGVGCGGPQRVVSPEEAARRMQTADQKNRLQDRLLSQALAAPRADYQDYKIGPEDLLEVTFFGQNELYREVRVNGQGEIDLPLVGAAKVGGLSPHQASKKLAAMYQEGRFLKNPQITVSVKEYRHQRVAVSGAVNKPDYYEIIGPRTLLEVLGMAGGLNEKAGDVVHVIRQAKADNNPAPGKLQQVQSFTPGSETIVIDLNRLVNDNSAALNVPVKNGDVVFVPFAKNAYVLGAVNKPGNVPVKENITVAQAVAMAGGTNPMLASSKVSVVRFDERGERITIPLNLDSITKGAAADLALKDNDIIYVHESVFRRFLFDIRNLNPGMFSMGMGLPAF